MNTAPAKQLGTLLPLWMLPDKYGIGTFGAKARELIDAAAEAGFTLLQRLPENAVLLGKGMHNGAQRIDACPYMAASAFAINPLYVDLEQLQSLGLLSQENLDTCPQFSDPSRVDYDTLVPWHQQMMATAAANISKNDALQTAFQTFQTNNQWALDYARFVAVGAQQGHWNWQSWADDYRHNKVEAVNALLETDKIAKSTYERVLFEQFMADRQQREFKEYASDQGVEMIGDIPMYVAGGSADVWAHQDFFLLDPETSRPTHVSGAKAGGGHPAQVWGHPLYDWSNPNVQKWWIDRILLTLQRFGHVRLDHFDGFVSFAAIRTPEGYTGSFEDNQELVETITRESAALPPEATTLEMRKGPGIAFFNALFERMDEANIDRSRLFVEDVGVSEKPEIQAIIEQLGEMRGMRMVQNAIHPSGDEVRISIGDLPMMAQGICYPGNHDNNTLVGWLASLPPDQKQLYRELIGYALGIEVIGISDQDMAAYLMDLCMLSDTEWCILPVWDLLGWDESMRPNAPGSFDPDQNWNIRIQENQWLSFLKRVQETGERHRKYLEDDDEPAEGIAEIRERIEALRQILNERFPGSDPTFKDFSAAWSEFRRPPEEEIAREDRR